jgi:hypothetical protein
MIVAGVDPQASNANAIMGAQGRHPVPRRLNNDRNLDAPKFSVPAQPWTRLTTDDNFMSQLVSIFVNTSNVYWRYLEEDLFLESMQSGELTAKYCSPFLVNAVCAMACVSQSVMSHMIEPSLISC